MLVALLIFACVATGGMVGLWLHTKVPDHYRNEESLDAIKLTTGMISVLAALVLGLLTTSVRGEFDALNVDLRDYAAQMVALDGTLRVMEPHHGPGRRILREYIAHTIAEMDGPSEYADLSLPGRAAHAAASIFTRLTGGSDRSWHRQGETEPVLGRLRPVVLDMEAPTALKVNAVRAIDSILTKRWQLHERTASQIMPPFLVVITFWATVIFVAFGFSSPRNAAVVVALLVAAASLSACCFLLVEMDRPFEGIITISSLPLRDALAHVSQP